MKTRPKRQRNWWMGNVRSRDVGNRLRLVPFWERGLVRSDRLELIIDPGPSFGAGDHPTTLMALEFLETAVEATCQEGHEATMLDVGTGTGVLALAGKALGTGFTVGLDVDPAAVITARRNIVLNNHTILGDQANPVHLFVGPVDAVNARFQIVAANLAAPTLLRLSGQILATVGRFLILSGMAEAMVNDVLEVYAGSGLQVISQSRTDGWNAALLEVCRG